MLASGLPKDSPLSLARNEGKVWSLDQQLYWMVLGEITRMNYYMRGYMKIKPRQDKFKWPKTPWDEADKPTQYGRVAAEDQDAAIAYLKSLSPTK